MQQLFTIAYNFEIGKFVKSNFLIRKIIKNICVHMKFQIFVQK